MKELLKSRKRIFYVSEHNGNDKNNGKTPFEAWKTLKNVNSPEIQDGDAVLFEGGSIWRDQLICNSGVLYGSYGSGRPMFFGSVSGGSINDWREHSPGIWMFKIPIDLDAGMVVCNRGKFHGIKKIVGLDELREPLDFYHDPTSGYLYVFSIGNPAEKYTNIEIGVRRHIIYLDNHHDIHIEGLVLRYGGAHGIQGVDSRNIVIKDCDISWIGGSVQFARPEKTVRYGNAVEFWTSCDNVTVEGCHINQVYDAGITHQYQLDPYQEPYRDADVPVIMNNITYRNNLIENCNYMFEFFLSRLPGTMKNIVIENNVCKGAGNGLCAQRPDKGVAAHIKGSAASTETKNFVIKNNVFFDTTDRMISCGDLDNSISFSGNKYICKKGVTFYLNHDKKIIADENTAEQFKAEYDHDAIIDIVDNCVLKSLETSLK